MGRIQKNDPEHSRNRNGTERERELDDAHRARKTRRYPSMLLHWMGRWLRRPRRPHVAPLPSVESGQVGISFAGHASVLLRYENRTIACDPMLGRWVKGVKRATMPGLTPADLHDVDLILISHGHVDHLHRPTLATLPKSATVILPPRTAQLVSDLGFARVVELSPDQSIQDHGVDVATVAVHHGSQDAPALGYVIRGQGPSVFFCGDSGYFPGFAEIGERYAPDIAMLPIGGYAPPSFRERHMSPLDALYALEDLGARIMIPIHHGAFALSYERLDEPQRWLDELVEERRLQDFVVTLEPGQSRVFVPPRVKSERDPLTSRDDAAGSGGAGPAQRAHQDENAESEARLAGSELLSALYGADAGADASDRPRPIFLHALPDSPAAAHMRTTSWHTDPPWATSEHHARARTVRSTDLGAEWSPVEVWFDDAAAVPEALEGEDTSPMKAASDREIENALAVMVPVPDGESEPEPEPRPVDGPGHALLFDELADHIDRHLDETEESGPVPENRIPEPIPEEISGDIRIPHHIAAALF